MIAIIAILASIALPVIGKVKTKAMNAKTKIQMGEIEQATATYKNDYSRFPLSDAIYTLGTDFTYGTTGTGHSTTVVTGSAIERNNKEIVAILTAVSNFRDGSATVNTNNQHNVKKDQYLNANPSDSGRPGIGEDGIYRDVWGSPFVVSFDANFDGRVYDSFYRNASVSQKDVGSPSGFNGLVNTDDPTGASNDYSLVGDVMIWSFGPDKLASTTFNAESHGDIGGDKVSNADNVLSWAD